MKKSIAMILMLILIVASLSACSGSNSSAASPDEMIKQDENIIVTDHDGNLVELPQKIERIAVCDILPLPSVLSVFFDSADKIVAMSPSSMSAAENSLLAELYPEILKADTSAINGSNVNTEELMKLDPQVVFYNASSTQLGETLRKAGFNAVAISVNKWEYNAVETLNQWLDLLSKVFPEEANERAALVRQYSEESMKLVKERTNSLKDNQRARAFFLYHYGDSTIVTSGKRFFGQWWADSIGADNVAMELSEDNSVKVTMEQIYKWNPNTILITNFNTFYPEDLYTNAVGSYDWSGIDAVRDHKVYKMPLGMYRSYTPGIDTPITLLWMAKTVYPDLFSDIDITEKTIEYYKTIFGITLTDEQANSIFAPVSNAGKTNF
jgi:iron complex transport system substrate-binding protein